LPLCKNFASVKFSDPYTMDTKAMIEKATGGLELVTEGDTSHYKRTTTRQGYYYLQSGLAVQNVRRTFSFKLACTLSFIKII
jgi:hypothetical protein